MMNIFDLDKTAETRALRQVLALVQPEARFYSEGRPAHPDTYVIAGVWSSEFDAAGDPDDRVRAWRAKRPDACWCVIALRGRCSGTSSSAIGVRWIRRFSDLTVLPRHACGISRSALRRELRSADDRKLPAIIHDLEHGELPDKLLGSLSLDCGDLVKDIRRLAEQGAFKSASALARQRFCNGDIASTGGIL